MMKNNVIKLLYQVRPLTQRPIQIVPATEEELRRFEQVHGINLPTELRSWFEHCNGANINPGGLNGVFAKDESVCLDWFFKEYPAWKEKGWFPIASDGCGDLYIMTSQITIPSTRTHPVCFLDQSDFNKPQYVVASGIWSFLYFLLKTEVLRDQGEEPYWPFSKEHVLAIDPEIAECKDIPLPWEIDSE